MSGSARAQVRSRGDVTRHGRPAIPEPGAQAGAERGRFCRGSAGGEGRRHRRRVKPSALLLHHVVPDGGGRSVLKPGQLGAGCLLATAASRDLSATELGLLALLEPILGPVWVWVLMGENPGTATVAGGAIVMGAVLSNEAFAAWRGRAVVAPTGR